MRIAKIPKGRGKFRTIYMPSQKEKEVLYRALPSIARKDRQQSGEHVHGFIRGRSAVTAATAHVGHAWTVTYDLRDFFDSCTAAMCKGLLTKEQLEVCLVDGAPRQGLPTSPAVANLAASALDKAILKVFDKDQVIYTRYADDLTFSGDSPEALVRVQLQLPQIVSRCGFKLAEEKTQLYLAKAGRRIVLGIGVGDSAIHPMRSAKRRLRAAGHRGNAAHARGLAEWCKLRPPKALTTGGGINSENILDECLALAKHYKLGSIAADKLPDKGTDEILGDNAVITGDPVILLGMSLFTTGWTSCASLATGGRKRGCVFWAHLRGTRAAVVYHETKSESHAGVTRRLMRARCLVHTMRDGSIWFDRMYGEGEAQVRLKELLEARGIKSVKNATKGLKVVGHAPARWRAWFDSLGSSTAKATEGVWSGKQVRICVTK